MPVRNVTVKTNLWYVSGSTVGSTIFEIMEERRRETTATGPIAISLELPIIAYIRGGTTLVSIMAQEYRELNKKKKESLNDMNML